MLVAPAGTVYEVPEVSRTAAGANDEASGVAGADADE
jgi:hypothetical protein